MVKRLYEIQNVSLSSYPPQEAIEELQSVDIVFFADYNHSSKPVVSAYKTLLQSLEIKNHAIEQDRHSSPDAKQFAEETQAAIATPYNPATYLIDVKDRKDRHSSHDMVDDAIKDYFSTNTSFKARNVSIPDDTLKNILEVKAANVKRAKAFAGERVSKIAHDEIACNIAELYQTLTDQEKGRLAVTFGAGHIRSSYFNGEPNLAPEIALDVVLKERLAEQGISANIAIINVIPVENMNTKYSMTCDASYEKNDRRANITLFVSDDETNLDQIAEGKSPNVKSILDFDTHLTSRQNMTDVMSYLQFHNPQLNRPIEGEHKKRIETALSNCSYDIGGKSSDEKAQSVEKFNDIIRNAGFEGQMQLNAEGVCSYNAQRLDKNDTPDKPQSPKTELTGVSYEKIKVNPEIAIS